MKLFIKDFFSKCDQIRMFLRIWSQLLQKSLIENFMFDSLFRSFSCTIYSPNFIHHLIEWHETSHP